MTRIIKITFEPKWYWT